MNKILFCGFGKLGKICLQTLISEGYHITYVLTHKEMDKESVDTFCCIKNIDYTYTDARKYIDGLKNILYEKAPDYLISVNYRYILPKEIFQIPKYAFNIHGSLLPKFRGRTPHVWSIINGEAYSGVSSHIVEEIVDSGDIIHQIPVKIESDDTGFSLLQKFEVIYPTLLCQSLIKLKNNEDLIKQDENKASYYGKRTPDMGYIDFRKCSRDVLNFIRAQAPPYPGAYYFLNNGKKIIIHRAEIDNFMVCERPIGVIYQDNSDYFVKCNNNILRITDYELSE